MRIAVFNTMTPFVRGGAEILVDDLVAQLKLHGHEATLFRLPFPESFEEPLLNTFLAASMLDFSAYDRLIAFKYPAYCALHPNKVLWLFHQFRQVYDLWGSNDGILPSLKGNAIKDWVTRSDDSCLSDARQIYVNASEVARRLMRFNGIQSTVLSPPLKDYEKYTCNNTGDYIFYPSRITNLKRQHLAIEAMRYTNSEVKLIISGRCESQAYIDELTDIVKKHKLQSKITIRNEWISDDEKIELMAGCLAALYIPYLEDSHGFVTMEAFYSSKPVITCLDSGGTIDFIEDGRTGIFSEPDAKALAAAMDRLYKDKKSAEEMGCAARQKIESMDITWPETIRKLMMEI